MEADWRPAAAVVNPNCYLPPGIRDASRVADVQASDYNSSLIPCYGGAVGTFPGAGTSLPPGKYTARQPYKITKNGASYTVYQPLTLEMLP